MAGTISDWIIEMEKAGLEDLAKAFHSEKLKDYERLKKSGLPTFDDFVVSFSEFNINNEGLNEFLAKYNSFVVRAIPNTKELPRRYKIGVHDFEECKDFLNKNIEKKNKNKYSVLLTEHEPTDWAGVIISRPGDVFVEVAKSELDRLSHGLANPSTGIFSNQEVNHFNGMRYNTENIWEREFMWKALKYIRKDLPGDSDIFPNINFMKGYFEFVKIKGTDKIKFLDFKVNDAYLG